MIFADRIVPSLEKQLVKFDKGCPTPEEVANVIRVRNNVLDQANTISNISQVPYRNVDYNTINSVGRSWIFEYTLALVKEILGYVRGKYTQVPIPGAEVTLNQADLLTSSTADKNALIDRLRAYFDDTSRQKLLERRQAESIARNSELEQVPMTIFIG